MKKYHLHVNNREKKNQQLYHNRSKHGTSGFPVKTAQKKKKKENIPNMSNQSRISYFYFSTFFYFKKKHTVEIVSTGCNVFLFSICLFDL